MGLFNRNKQEKREAEDPTLSAFIKTDTITKSDALNISSVSSCVEFISNIVSMLPIKLYQDIDGKISEITDDTRIYLLNDDTGDKLDPFQMKKSYIVDYLLEGDGYIYINRERNNVKSLHYVDSTKVSIMAGVDPIFKDYDIMINGQKYRDFEFIKILRNSVDGGSGVGIVKQNQKSLAVAYNALVYENILSKTGGNRKGFLQTNQKISKEYLEELKEAWYNLYSNSNENLMILNEGLTFTQSSATATETQMNENKKTNADEICKLFNLSNDVVSGKATDEQYNSSVKIAVLPILKAIETALNRDLLLESEKGSFYFVFDTKDLLKGSTKERYAAYTQAVQAGWISKNEIRYLEDLPAIAGLDVITMSLGDVIYDIENKKYFTPNTDKITNSNMKGGEIIDENRNP